MPGVRAAMRLLLTPSALTDCYQILVRQLLDFAGHRLDVNTVNNESTGEVPTKTIDLRSHLSWFLQERL